MSKQPTHGPLPFLRRALALFAAGAALVTGVAAEGPEIELLDGPLTPTIARQCFEEARQACERDDGRLWGVRLCGPILLADPTTRAVIASQADRDGRLTSEDGVYAGILPPEETIAGTVKEWAGVTWVMLPWPLPKEKRERVHFLTHEMFHRVQGQLGLAAADEATSHLETRDGRIWLQLEWRALRSALQHTGPERAQAVGDALLFREYRRSLCRGCAGAERAQEIAEGLAEYTGVRLSTDSERTALERALWNFERAQRWPTLTRSFAYVSGPLYGLLLDQAKPDWRRGLRADHDLGGLLRDAFSVALPEMLETAAKQRAKTYDVEELTAREDARAGSAQQRLAAYRQRLVTGPTLVIPIQSMQFQFDPREVHSLDDLGKVYPKLKMTDAWGTLEVTGGALVANDWSKVIVPAPGDARARPLQGDGWTLKLNAGWELRPGKRQGDYVVQRE